MNGTPLTRYHAEIKVTVDGREARINAFRDTLAEIFTDLSLITQQIPGDWRNGAKREIVNAERKAEQLQRDGALPNTVAKKLSPKTPPVCVNCGSTNTELINWTDKDTGQPRHAWKCQGCRQWLPSKKA